MAFIFGDGFDWYTTTSDAYSGYWDTGNTGTSWQITTGRFTGSQAAGAVGASFCFGKNSGSNDAVHHFFLSWFCSSALSGTTQWITIQLLDGTTNQCAIVFRSDGALQLYRGGPSGTLLATSPVLLSANVWIPIEFEVAISGSAGSFTIRTNGSSTNTYTAGPFNTSATGNAYANAIQIGWTSVTGLTASSNRFDDFLWFNTSGAAPNTWVGDIRTYQLMPTSDVSTSFSPSSNPFVVNTGNVVSTVSTTTGTARYQQFTASATGTISTATIQVNTGGTGNIKAAIFTNNGGLPGTVLATSNVVVNPSAGFVAFTFPSPASVTRNTVYWIGFDQDFTIVFVGGNVSSATLASATAYASFPTSNPTTGTNQLALVCAISIGSPTNSSLVQETTEDSSTSYVYSSTVGAADFYGCSSLPGTPASILAVTTRGFGQKSDAGTRIGQVQMKSGSTTVQSGAVGTPSSFAWQFRTDVTDPNTGQTWTASGVNNLQIGPYIGG